VVKEIWREKDELRHPIDLSEEVSQLELQQLPGTTTGSQPNSDKNASRSLSKTYN
jgi:hypothetical protein